MQFGLKLVLESKGVRLEKPKRSYLGYVRSTVYKLVVALLIVALVVGCREHDCWSRHGRLAREAALKDGLFQMRKAIGDFYADHKRYPAELQDLVPVYCRRIPPDPMTDRSETWIVERQNGVVVDVKSGAPGKTCDGTAYSAL